MASSPVGAAPRGRVSLTACSRSGKTGGVSCFNTSPGAVPVQTARRRRGARVSAVCDFALLCSVPGCDDGESVFEPLVDATAGDAPVTDAPSSDASSTDAGATEGAATTGSRSGDALLLALPRCRESGTGFMDCMASIRSRQMLPPADDAPIRRLHRLRRDRVQKQLQRGLASIRRATVRRWAASRCVATPSAARSSAPARAAVRSTGRVAGASTTRFNAVRACLERACGAGLDSACGVRDRAVRASFRPAASRSRPTQ